MHIRIIHIDLRPTIPRVAITRAPGSRREYTPGTSSLNRLFNICHQDPTINIRPTSTDNTRWLAVCNKY
ncbi:MAG: hypothetical protein AAFQ07_16470 [Chloroflexota bacterium]